MNNSHHENFGVAPVGWEVKKLEEVAKFENGKAHEKNIDEGGKYIVVNSKFISSDGKKYKRSNKNLSPLDEGDIAMVMSDVPNGKALAKCFLVNENNKFTLNQRVCSIKAVGVYNEFLYFSLNRNRYYLAFDNGVGQTNLRKSEVLECPVLLPPIKEQHKIVSILSSINKTIEKTEAIIGQTEKVKKGLMQQLLTKGIGHTRFKKTKMGEIPLGWEVKELVELSNSNDRYAFTGGPFGSNLKSSDYTEDGVRIIQLQNIKDGYFANDYKIYTSESKANELFSCNIYPGDIIIAKMAEPVARACIIPNYSDRYLMASDGIRLSVDKTKYITEYVTYAINAPYFRQQAVNNSTGTTRLRIGLSTLRSLKILVPSIEEQKKIADILINIDRKIEKEQSKVLKLKELKEGLMQSLLTGKVRVKVDEAEVTQV
ncbi:restriction endonuclease subunit S [Bacillus cereus group sp. BceL297]|uniref:restriction endonuclease subunit S n=1 Tax=Bacillus TaxID=1386 RepID=UPI000B5361ED|nr:restriction endonuclease subunit S [Bacillus sp. MB353a]OWW08602.1 hypothetical protein BUE63_20495 [Bacillus sp. MB353a]